MLLTTDSVWVTAELKVDSIDALVCSAEDTAPRAPLSELMVCAIDQ